jgi:hypothetical protein
MDVRPAVTGTELGFRWALGGTRSESPYAALVMPAGNIAAYDRLMFIGRSSGPTRVSVQLRAPDGTAGKRWHRSVYLDETPRQIAIAFDDMRSRGVTGEPRPVLSRVDSVLFVIDTTNAETGSNGQFVVDDVGYAR